MSVEKKRLPKECYEKIDKIVKNQQSSRQLFEEVLTIAREKGFSDFEIELSIKDYLLKEKQIPKSTFYRYFSTLKPKPALTIDMEQSYIQSVPMGQTNKDDSIIDEMPDEIYDKALSEGLTEEKLAMIAKANRRLKDHPMLQKHLIQDIKDVSNDEAKLMVAQTVSDVETGYYEKTKGGYMIHSSQREKISLKEPVEKPPFLRLLDIEEATTKLLFNLTDHKLVKGKEFDYTEEIIKNSAGFILSVIKTANFAGIMALKQSLELNKFAIDQALKMIKEERESRKEKKDLMEK